MAESADLDELQKKSAGLEDSARPTEVDFELVQAPIVGVFFRCFQQ